MKTHKKLNDDDFFEICAKTSEIMIDRCFAESVCKEEIFRYHKELKLNHAQHQAVLMQIGRTAIQGYNEAIDLYGPFDFRTINEKALAELSSTMMTHSTEKEWIADYNDGSVELASNETIYVQ